MKHSYYILKAEYIQPFCFLNENSCIFIGEFSTVFCSFFAGRKVLLIEALRYMVSGYGLTCISSKRFYACRIEEVSLGRQAESGENMEKVIERYSDLVYRLAFSRVGTR